VVITKTEKNSINKCCIVHILPTYKLETKSKEVQTQPKGIKVLKIENIYKNTTKLGT